MVTTRYIYDGFQLLGEADENNEVTRLYTNEPDEYTHPIGHTDIATGESFYYHFDGTGSTRQVTDETENVTDEFVYDSWGNVLERAGMTHVPFQFGGEHGYYRDEELENYYVMARVYDPSSARWYSIDPTGYTDGMNRFIYVLNSPVDHIDPSGYAGAPIKYGPWLTSLLKDQLIDGKDVDYLFEWERIINKKNIPVLALQFWMVTEKKWYVYGSNPGDPPFCYSLEPAREAPIPIIDVLLIRRARGGKHSPLDTQSEFNKGKGNICLWITEATVTWGIDDGKIPLPKLKVNSADGPWAQQMLVRMKMKQSFEYRYLYYNRQNCCICNNHWQIAYDADSLGFDEQYEMLETPWATITSD